MKRIEWVDFGKGLTILFVMLVHVIEGVFKTKGYESYDDFSKIFMAIVFTFIMPVFFALSGFLYHPINDFRVYISNIIKKGVNLFVPYIAFSVVYVALQHFSSNIHTLYSWTDLIFIFEKPIGYLWFLYILFFIFVFVGLLDLLKIKMWWQITIYFLSFIVSQFVNMPYLLKGTLTWTICFYSGYLLKSVYGKWNNNYVFFSVISILIVISGIYQYTNSIDWYHTNVLTLDNFLTKMVSIPVAFFIFMHIKRGKFFQYFRKYGKYSLIIYLVHAPTSSIVRAVMLKMSITNYFVLILGISLITWYISLFVCWLSSKYMWIDAIFSPYKYINCKK